MSTMAEQIAELRTRFNNLTDDFTEIKKAQAEIEESQIVITEKLNKILNTVRGIAIGLAVGAMLFGGFKLGEVLKLMK